MDELSIARKNNQDKPWDQRILFLSGRVSLDLAQSGGPGPYRRFERLHSPEDLSHWFWLSALALPDLRTSQAELELAYRLRSAIWQAANSLRQGQPPQPGDVDTINLIAAAPPLIPQLEPDAYRHRWRQPATAQAALASVARDAIDLFAHQEEWLIRQCAADDCALLFVDHSRPGQRKWCAMERCGNRAKVARHRQRKQGRPRGG